MHLTRPELLHAFFSSPFTTQFARVSAYLNERIPEICDTEIEDPSQLLDDEKTAAAM